MLTSYIQAAFPAVAVSTVEEERFIQHVLNEFPTVKVLSISGAGGLKDARVGTTLDGNASFADAFRQIASLDQGILVVSDWQHIARNAIAYRSLKDRFSELKARGCCIVLLAPNWHLPLELEHDVPVIEWKLPTRFELKAALDAVAESIGQQLTSEAEAACLDAAAGLTQQEAENAFALAAVECGRIHSPRVEQEKMRLVKNSGYLEVWPAVSPEHVGGMSRLKDYFDNEVLACKDDEDLRVRGILLVGIPGTGKSLAAKAAGAMSGWPVLRMDIGALKGSLLGQSESNMRAALKLAEAVAPCVLWLDELEKSIGGYQSSAQTDSGVTLGMVGSLLTWMQEHKSPILTIATANDHEKLPAELTRAGRFDEKFFVDLPSREERERIASIHLLRFGCSTEGTAVLVAALTQAWTGAEIEQLIKSAARRSQRQITPEVLRACAADIKPLSTIRPEETQALRDWAHSSLRLANSPDAEPGSSSPKRTVARSGTATIGGLSMN